MNIELTQYDIEQIIKGYYLSRFPAAHINLHFIKQVKLGQLSPSETGQTVFRIDL